MALVIFVLLKNSVQSLPFTVWARFEACIVNLCTALFGPNSVCHQLNIFLNYFHFGDEKQSYSNGLCARRGQGRGDDWGSGDAVNKCYFTDVLNFSNSEFIL